MAASSGSSSGGSWSGGGGVRAVRLVRRTTGKLGFSVRGGREHRTGFFVTAVEPSSEAAAQGLQVGDQIVRVNGYPVDDATHRELLQLIQGQTTVLLKVRSVGMIPVKDDDGDELSWRIVDQPTGKESLQHYQRLVLTVPNRAKLGCGICKGPEWKPGIFVQFTKENSIARLGGLAPGDQIVQCNNVTFTPDIPFNQAVSIMRGCGVLELLVCKAAALDLFPGESSGYNSSASSVAGDPPPQTNGNHHNGNHHNGNHLGNGNHHTNGNHHNGHSTSNIYTNGSHTNGYKDDDSVTRRREGATIIQVNGPHHSTVSNNSNVAEICVVSQQLETKTTTVLVEVHHSEDDANNQSDVSTDRLTNSSLGSFTSSAGSLTSAISQELERRSKRPVGSNGTSKGRAPPQPPKEKLLKGSGLTQEELDQHDRLMQEFKKVHQKMFSSQSPDQASLSSSTIKEEPVDVKVPEKNHSEVISSVRRENDVEQRKARNKKHPAPPPPPPPMPKEVTVPPCPTPDYDTLSVTSDAKTCEPSDSTLNSHSTINSNHTSSTILVKDKPLVTIREYPTNQPVKHPSKLEFLNQQLQQNNHHQQSGHPPAMRLQSELSQTLARSNLHQQATRDGSAAVIKINMEPEGKQAPFYLFPENGKRTNGNPPPPFTVANNSVRRKDSHGNHNGNHIINNNHHLSNGHHPNGNHHANGNHHPNGILKNGHNNNVSHVHIHNQDKNIPVKTIKFGNITTVIRDAEPKG